MPGRDTRGVFTEAELCVRVPACTIMKNICKGDKINCLLYTAHTDTHSYVIRVYVLNAWMLIVANTVIRHKCTLITDYF